MHVYFLFFSYRQLVKLDEKSTIPLDSHPNFTYRYGQTLILFIMPKRNGYNFYKQTIPSAKLINHLVKCLFDQKWFKIFWNVELNLISIQFLKNFCSKWSHLEFKVINVQDEYDIIVFFVDQYIFKTICSTYTFSACIKSSS